ncbi:MAG: isoprenylcysteine carboxylmethyltransferase family protein [gamma proteobacterium endosymbiont of Lamellibrachia anaximandri]|nr:isoprenylcysteine carboxylmethyltransferase family protein [gamma proteobacterium endosymbiont of Lamellibrachia anaximandri]MBL3535410.1 isoprenylcysteine carboxylmethyltransferase family protein [gamma proteobacterium endosymbiont of Lamellibrachia anaximandri]
MTLSEKIKLDGAPILLFALIVGSKTYALWSYLADKPNLWMMLENISSMGQDGAYYLTNELTYILYFITALAFDFLAFYSFIVRGEAKSKPQGFWENLFPLLTVFVPVICFTLLFFPQVRQFVPGYSPETLEIFRSITPLFSFYFTMTGFIIGLFGAAFSIWAISYLKRSFGLRAAVRTLVTTGPYSRIRHPLYFGEIVHIFGIAILSGTPVGLYLFVGAVVLQIIRAKIEERKFMRTLAEYDDYRKSTDFLWPKLARL